MIFSDLEQVTKLLSERHVATIYAHNADDFVKVMIGEMPATVYSRSASPKTSFTAFVAGILVSSQPFLLPGTALLIDQFGQIMQVCRYEAEGEAESKGGTGGC